MSAYMHAENPINRVHESCDTTSDEDSTSTPKRIRLKTDPYILQDFKTFAPSFTASVAAFQTPKEPPKAAVEDTPSEDIYPSDSVRRSTRTGESTHTSSSQAAPSFTSSLHSMRPRNALICDDNPHLETISHSCRSEPHPHAPPSN
jgi:hypothetical protein